MSRVNGDSLICKSGRDRLNRAIVERPLIAIPTLTGGSKRSTIEPMKLFIIHRHHRHTTPPGRAHYQYPLRSARTLSLSLKCRSVFPDCRLSLAPPKNSRDYRERSAAARLARITSIINDGRPATPVSFIGNNSSSLLRAVDLDICRILSHTLHLHLHRIGPCFLFVHIVRFFPRRQKKKQRNGW